MTILDPDNGPELLIQEPWISKEGFKNIITMHLDYLNSIIPSHMTIITFLKSKLEWWRRMVFFSRFNTFSPYGHNVNQLAITLFRDLLPIRWFVTINVHKKVLSRSAIQHWLDRGKKYLRLSQTSQKSQMVIKIGWKNFFCRAKEPPCYTCKETMPFHLTWLLRVFQIYKKTVK